MVEVLTQFQLSIFAIFALGALTINIYIKDEIYSFSNRLFKVMLVNTIFIMILEILSWIFDGKSGVVNYSLNYGFNFLLFIFSTTVPGFWAAYIDYKVYGDPDRVKRRLWYQYPFFIATVIGIINLFVPVVFTISPENVYERLPFIFVNFVMVYLLIIHSFVQVMIHRKKLRTNTLVAVVILLLFPAIASYIQYMNFGLILMWPVLAVTLLINYLFLETQSSSKDYLTGLYNRSRLDEVVQRKVYLNESFTVIMIDLDNYKRINDTYGHLKGDQAIIIFSKLLSSIFLDSGLVARYGGDEFIVVIDTVDDEKIKEYKKQIIKRVSEYEDDIFSQVKFSYGYSSRTELNSKDFQQLLTEADDFMYQDKAINKNYKRRKDDK